MELKMKYPTDEQLETITKWNDYSSIHNLLAYVKNLWTFAERGWQQYGNTYHIATSGWSGNEDIINAMQSNFIWWSMFWYQSNRGGHYTFSSREWIKR